MKIDEAVNVINSTMTVRAKVDDGVMYVHKKLNRDDDWFMRFSLYHLGWSAITADFDNCLDDDVDVTDLARVMDVIQRLLDTPVNERFPKKKYRLRWIDSNWIPNYLDNRGGVWTTESITNARCYTESELDQLKKDNPRLAPAIDAMKEEVKDDEAD